MLKIKIVKITEEVEEVESIICNKCGKQCPDPMNVGQIEYALFSANWGYGSHRDGNYEESHICPDCYEEIISSFIIKDFCKNQ